MRQHVGADQGLLSSHRLRWAVAAAGLISALAAICTPAGDPETAEIAAILVVGALAMLAGHKWGLLVVVAADVVLIGQIWPAAIYQDPPDRAALAAVYTSLAGALPGLLLLYRAIPEAVDIVWAERGTHRVRRLSAALCTTMSVAWIAMPLVG